MSTTEIDRAKAPRQIKTVEELLQNPKVRERLMLCANDAQFADRLVRVLPTAFRTTPKLKDCDPLSMLGALQQCATLKLEPNTILGHAYLIPFENKRKRIVEVQLILGYKGLKELARRHELVVGLHADVVYDDDEDWSYEYGTNMHLTHKPGPRRGKKTHAYCYVKLRDGSAFVVLPWAEVLRRRDTYSQGYRSAVRFGKEKDHPWVKDEDAMAAKTAVRALANAGDMPMSLEFREAMALDEARADYAGLALGEPGAGGGPALLEEEDDGDDGVVDEDPPSQQQQPAAVQQPERSAAFYRRAGAAGGARSKKTEPARDGDLLDAASDEGAKINMPEQQPPAEHELRNQAGEIIGGNEEVPGAAEIPEEVQVFVARIESDLAGCSEPGHVEQTMELWADTIAQVGDNCPAGYDAIQAIADAARERVAAG
jgi:recombination protein RecT